MYNVHHWCSDLCYVKTWTGIVSYIRCVLLLLLVVRAEYDFTPECNLDLSCFHPFQSLFLYQYGSPHVLLCCFSVRDFIKMLSFCFVFEYCIANNNKDIIFYEHRLKISGVFLLHVLRITKKNPTDVCWFRRCLEKVVRNRQDYCYRRKSWRI